MTIIAAVIFAALAVWQLAPQPKPEPPPHVPAPPVSGCIGCAPAANDHHWGY